MHSSELRQLTRDHTLVQKLHDSGAMACESAAQSPIRHILTNSVAISDSSEGASTTSVQLHPGDQILLTTDGMTDVTAEPQIASILNAEQDPQAAADRMVEFALTHGSRDNVSLIVARAC